MLIKQDYKGFYILENGYRRKMVPVKCLDCGKDDFKTTYKAKSYKRCGSCRYKRNGRILNGLDLKTKRDPITGRFTSGKSL